MPEAKKKRTCTICGSEHNVGEACPECGWDHEREERLAKADRVRKELRDTEKAPARKSLFDY